MKKLTIGIVAEGPTDSMLLEALIDMLLQSKHRYLEIQPKKSKTGGFGVHGGGWHGVKRLPKILKNSRLIFFSWIC
ncbi:MAG: hypothetical protein DRR19_14205 [Candidatus Parabeggiatoa sp. nov. 1]|nr:MAG: hypothetical protein DRR19_14205 [Gammaproteobacteria bacterium]